MAAASNALASAKKPNHDWFLPLAAVAVVFVMLVPIPAFLLDILLASSITLAVLVLLSALQILRPVQFPVFPTLLLLLTLFRLSLNLASTRRILLHGSEGTSSAGHLIESFGQFVVSGNYVVGFVVSLALIDIQYLVINHGAVRTAGVSARFTLDALPGKQMAIDADLNSGVIDERTARARREQIAREAEFYGAMDGAARFSQRDALATILITAINIIAGFLIGVFQHGMTLQDALTTYTILTVGDDLVTLIPSLLVSVAGGIVVTRATSDDPIGTEVGRQLFSKRRTLYLASGVMTSLALIPGLPKFSFLLLAGSVAYLGYRTPDLAASPAGKETEIERKPGMQEQLEALLKLDDIDLEVCFGLIPLVDQKVETREPAFGVPARWLATNMRDTALGAGYAVVEQTSVIATHLAELVCRHAHEVLTRQETKRLLNALSEAQPKLVEELVPRVLSLGEVEKILQQLLREQVSIRDLPTILETLIDASAVNRSIVSLVEAVRQALGRALVQPLLQDDGKLKVLALDPTLEDEINRAFEPAAAAARPPALQTGFLRRVAGEQIAVASPIVLCSSPARFHLRHLLEPFVPRIVVLSPAEIPPVVPVQSLGVVQ